MAKTRVLVWAVSCWAQYRSYVMLCVLVWMFMPLKGSVATSVVPMVTVWSDRTFESWLDHGTPPLGGINVVPFKSQAVIKMNLTLPGCLLCSHTYLFCFCIMLWHRHRGRAMLFGSSSHQNWEPNKLQSYLNPSNFV